MSDAQRLAQSFEVLLLAGERLEMLPALMNEVRQLNAQHTAHRLAASSEGGLHPDYYYTYKKAAPFLGLTPEGVRTLCTQGKLPRQGSKILGVYIMWYRGDPGITREVADAYRVAKSAPVLRLVKSHQEQ